jgi:phosphohistidine phosphatase SixA
MFKRITLVDAVFCSSALRTKETFDLCADGFDFAIYCFVNGVENDN